MAGVMLAVGQGLLELDTVKKMLVNPRKVKFNKTALYKIPTYALYLKDVEYNPQGAELLWIMRQSLLNEYISFFYSDTTIYNIQIA